MSTLNTVQQQLINCVGKVPAPLLLGLIQYYLHTHAERHACCASNHEFIHSFLEINTETTTTNETTTNETTTNETTTIETTTNETTTIETTTNAMQEEKKLEVVVLNHVSN